MSITPNLVFFNKEGYPYNFKLNDGIWTGKIFFEPGSTDIFKSLTLYTLESVNPIEYIGQFDIINKEIYNDSGMTLSPGSYTNQLVTDILTVNQSSSFYTKWIYGNNFNRYFPKGTVISFSGNAQTGLTTGESDYENGKYYYTVLQTDRNAIMIGTITSNDNYSFIYQSGNTFYVNAHDCISIPDSGYTLSSIFNILPDEKVSVVGSVDGDNDGVYEVSAVTYTRSRVFDYNLSGLSYGDVIDARLTLLTERPLLYIGEFSMVYSGSTLYATFYGGRNSNITVGTTFICEDNAWNHLLLGNIYTVTSAITENYICTPTGMTFSGSSYEEDDGTIENVYTLRMNDTYNIEIGWNIRFDSGSTIQMPNNNLTKKVTDIISGITYVGESGITYYDFYFDSFVAYETGATYDIVHVLKPHEQTTVTVTSTISNDEYNGFARVLSNTNVVDYYQDVSNTGTTIVTDSIDMFINKYKYGFEANGIDVYRIDNSLIFDGKYANGYKSGATYINPYFNMSLYINNSGMTISSGYSYNISGDTYIYNIILKPCDIVYERANMSNNLSQSYDADILLDLYDDAQDFGFQLTVNGIQYYIPFNNTQLVSINSGDIYTIQFDVIRINFNYIGDIDTTATIILSGTSFVIKSTDEYFIWDFDGSQHNFDYNVNETIIITVNSTLFNITYNADDSLLNIENYIGTTNTIETIKDFITKYHDVFYYNGIDVFSGLTDIYSGTTLSGTTFVATLHVRGDEPNVNIYEMKVKVNRNSTYSLIETKNRYMMVTANKIEWRSGIYFTDLGFATGMILSVSGSTYPMNNKEFNIIGLDNDSIELSFQGPMYTDTGVTLSLKTREFLRKPRETNDTDIIYRYRWENDNSTNMVVTPQYEKYPSIFLYDLSGENLVPWGDNSLYAYTGPKPLVTNYDTVYLNREPNKYTEYVGIPYRQQTIFEELNFTLPRFDDDDASILPNPIQTFIGYNSKLEGVDQRNLIIERADDISYTGYTTDTDLYFVVSGSCISMISGDTSFLELGFKTGRYLKMRFDDNKPYTQEVFENYHDYLITNVTNTTITVDSGLTTFTTLDEDFYFEFILLPERIAYFRVYGETESEDERLEANMRLLGISLTEEDEFIFKQSDVTEDGIDYRLLNRKRKEMMNVYPEIYNYIGSYRAILNAISFFGYTDVELVEYYRNIKKDSPYYKKLKRAVIPDLLDREVEGWTYSEEIPSPLEYVKTSLLNLTYRITDEEGNNVLLYSLKEVQTKLNGLKHWLRRNVIPINSNIRDITGVSEVLDVNWRRFDPGTNFQKNVIDQFNEAVNLNYTATRNFNDNWLVSLRFYTISGDVPSYWDLKVITFKKDPDTGILYPEQRWDDQRFDLSNFNFSINWDGSGEDYNYDRFFYVETTKYNDNGVGKTINKMYRLEDGTTFYFDEFKNYTLVNNNFRYKTFPYVQNILDVYIIDENGNFWIVNKEIQASRI